MTILLATGIYPPDLGGPATYVKGLAEALVKLGHAVRVVTYGFIDNGQWTMDNGQSRMDNGEWIMGNDGVLRVNARGIFLVRWLRYARALRRHGHDADVVIAFSSVSVGVPLLLSRLRGPRRVLRLGGEFFWERYTDAGGMLGLDAWHRTRFGLWRLLDRLMMPRLLRSFHTIVYSTAMQQAIHRRTHRSLPPSTVIENAVPRGTPVRHVCHHPPALLVMSRFVGFKNLLAFIDALAILRDEVRCFLVGSGPQEADLRTRIASHGIGHIVRLLPPLRAEEKAQAFRDHDLLVVPSITDISPNAALEARAAGVPVLLTQATGLSSLLTQGMVTAALGTPQEIAAAIRSVLLRYDAVAAAAAAPLPPRDWSVVAREWQTLLLSLRP